MKRVMLCFIKFYKKHISFYLETRGVRCKYYPTCSEYAIQAIEKYGSIRGVALGVWRILRCNPFSKGGYDPLK